MYSHLSCIRQIARKLPRVCQPLDSQLASQTYMYFIIERECFYAIMLCFVDEKLQKLQSGWGSAPDPDGGAYSAPPYPLAGREGATPPPAPTPVLNQFHLIAFPNPPVSRSAYGPEERVLSLSGYGVSKLVHDWIMIIIMIYCSRWLLGGVCSNGHFDVANFNPCVPSNKKATIQVHSHENVKLNMALDRIFYSVALGLKPQQAISALLNFAAYSLRLSYICCV